MLFLWQVEFVLGGTSGCGRNKAIWLLNLLLLVLVNRIYDLFDASECQLALQRMMKKYIVRQMLKYMNEILLLMIG